MIRKVLCGIALTVLGVLSAKPVHAQTQTGGLMVTITHPGEGEALYSGPASTFVADPVMGFVATANGDVSLVQVRLDIYDGSKISASMTTTPKADGTFRFDVGINSNQVNDLNESEAGCDARCHMEKPFIFPAGQVTFHVTATDPQGHKATAVRSIVVDTSGYVDLPVQVVVDGAPGRTVAGLHVVADTRLYLWRARQYTAITDATGRATLRLERLAQAPTHYVVQMTPATVNGILYQPKGPTLVDIPAGAKAGQPVQLIVQAARGQINGTIVDSSGSTGLTGFTVRAVDLTCGAGYTTQIAQGRFTLADLPLDQFLVTVDSPAGQTIRVTPQTADLTTSSVATTTLTLATTSTRILRGLVRDDKGAPLPLAWITTDDHSQTNRVFPASGAFSLSGVGGGAHALVVTAPGYWSRQVAIGLGDLDVSLTPQPHTRVVPWGTGTVTLPSQTLGNLVGNRYILQRGWVWGSGSGEFVVSTPDSDITLSGGSFALEYIPGAPGWLYVPKGQAQVATDAAGPNVAVNAGQMVAFGGKALSSPVSLDDATIWALYEGKPAPVTAPLDSSFLAQVRDGIEGLGIPSTLALFAVAAIVLAVAVLIWTRRRRGHPAEPSE